jgi:hypothetical protein
MKVMNRRAVVRGFGGVVIGLPLLASLQDRRALAQSMNVAKRFIAFFDHGGYISCVDKDGRRYDGRGVNNGVDAWAPAAGEKLELGTIHQPLAAHTDSLLVLRGINNKACQEQSPYNGDHGWANVTALTAAKASNLSEEAQTSEGPSIDAVLAARLKERDPTPFSSIHLSVPAHNYGTPFFSAARQPSDGEYNPAKAFDKLFAGVSEQGEQPNPAALRARVLKKSILDGTAEGLSLFEARVSAADKIAIDAHLTHIRELEKQLAAVEVAPACKKPVLTGQDPKWDYYSVQIDKSGPAMVDVMVAAMRCGLTNVGAFEIGDFYAKFLNPTFPAAYDIGHSLHHSARDVGKTGPDGAKWQDWYDTMLKNRQWRMGLLARLLDGLAATPEGTGTMLDGTLLLNTSEFSTGADHSVADLPVLLAGKAGGQLKTGRHLNYNLKAAADPSTRQYQTESSTHNLFTSIMNLFGFDDAHFGSEHVWKKGPLSGLT